MRSGDALPGEVPSGGLVSGGAAAVAAAVLLAGCSGEGTRERPDVGKRPTVLVSVPPQAWLVDRIAGDLVDLEVMVPPGASPKTYEPTMSQMREVSAAELYLALGHPEFPFEQAWLPELRDAASGMEVVDTGAGCRREVGDPHIWVDPECALRMTDTTEAALARLVPADRSALARGAERTRELIEEVRAEVRRTLEPHRGRSFMVFHPAWGHLARAFGLRQLAIEAGGRDPSPAELRRLVRRAREEGIGVVFVQPQFSRGAAELVAAEIGARVAVLDPLGRDWDATLLDAARQLEASFRATPAGTADADREGS